MMKNKVLLILVVLLILATAFSQYQIYNLNEEVATLTSLQVQQQEVNELVADRIGENLDMITQITNILQQVLN